ncbi:MAG: ribonuclease III [Rikenellaceae bacterium]
MIDFTLYITRRVFSKNKHFYKIIHNLFGIYANNIELYKLALIHKSASLQLEDGTFINNERLEFLGDAVIEAVVSDMIYIEYPFEDEGFLTQLRSKIVSRNSLNDISEKIGLSEHIISQNNLPSTNKHLSGDAFEAMMGAIYLDKGYDYVNRLLINKIFAQYIDLSSITETETDFKSRLIEWCQKNRQKAIIDSKQSNLFSEQHPQFQTEISIGSKVISYGIGDSKKEAEQRAAKNALEKLV